MNVKQANGILSWGVYYGYGLAFLFGTNLVEVKDIIDGASFS